MAFEFDVLIVPYQFWPNTVQVRFSVLFISVVAFVASRQKWDSIWFMAWLCFGSMVVFNAQRMLTMGVKKCFAICDQTVFLSLSSFAVHFARIFFCWFLILIIFSPPSSISKLSTFIFIFSNTLLALFHCYISFSIRTCILLCWCTVSTLCGKARTCRTWENCDNSRVLAIITFPYRVGFRFSHCLMVLIRFSILLVQLSSSVDTSFPAE